MKLELAILAGNDSKKFLADFAHQLDRLENLMKSVPKGQRPEVIKGVDEDELHEDAAETDDEDFTEKAAKTAKKNGGFDDDADDEVTTETEETEELETDEEEEDDAAVEIEEPPKIAAKGKTKKTTSPKYTVDDVNDACKARARAGGKDGRAQVLAILKKKFGTESVSALEVDQYDACIKAMAVKE